MVVGSSHCLKVTPQVAGLVLNPNSLTAEVTFLTTAVCCRSIRERLPGYWGAELNHIESLCWSTPTQQLRGAGQMAEIFLLFPPYPLAPTPTE